MQIYNWSYRAWNCQNKLRHNMVHQDIRIPRASRVTEIKIPQIVTENNHYSEECQCKTQGDREVIEYTIFENSDGCLCLEIQYLDGEHIFTKPIINCIHMRAHLLRAPENKKPVVCIISLNDFTDQIILFGSYLCVDGFEKLLTKKGIPILVGRYKRKLAIEIIFMYLMEHATVSELPDLVGWHQKKEGWFLSNCEAGAMAQIIQVEEITADTT